MNRVILSGRLVADPEVRQSDKTMVAKYRLAVDRRFHREEQTADFINCVSFGKAAEFTEKYMHKGGKFLVAGRIQTGSYRKTDGTTVYTTDIIVEDQEFCDSKNAEQTNAEPKQDDFTFIPDDMDGLPFA